MLKSLIVAFVGLTTFVATSLPTLAQRQANPAQDRDSIANGWRFDYAEAREEAARAKKPLMVVMRCVP
jgi:hypothetical protein